MSTDIPELTTDESSDEQTDDEPETCDGCGKRGDWYPLSEGVDMGYRAPEGEKLCTECLEERNTHTVDEMTDDELIAAIMDDSIGYASPSHAQRHVDDYRKGQEEIEAEGRKYGCWCERGSACFDNDLDELIESARRHWLILTDEKREELLDTVEGWRKVEEEQGAGASMGLSCMYPSMGI